MTGRIEMHLGDVYVPYQTHPQKVRGCNRLMAMGSPMVWANPKIRNQHLTTVGENLSNLVKDFVYAMIKHKNIKKLVINKQLYGQLSYKTVIDFRSRNK